MNEDFLSELRFRNPIEEIISSYVVLKRAGNTYKGLCPFHNEKTPSFTVYPQTGSYYCFGCQNGGDVITFIRSAENLDYMEAVRLLADKAGLNMPETGFDDTAGRIRRTVLEINRHTARFFHKNLIDKVDGGIGLKYFIERKLSPDTIKHFGLGYAPDSFTALTDHLKSLGYSEQDMIISGVCSKSSKTGRAYDRFRKKAIFPIIDLRGNVIAFGGRKFPEDDGAKYINTNDTPVYKKTNVVFGLNFAKNSKSDTIILTEGYMDTIALHQAGFTNAVGACGTAFTDSQAGLLARYFKEIVVTMDIDGPGQAATKRALQTLQKTGMKIRVLQVEGGTDPDEYIRENGAGKFKMLLEGAKNDIEFKLYEAKAKYDVATDNGKLQYLKEAVEILAGYDELAASVYSANVARDLSLDAKNIESNITKRRKELSKRNLNKKLRDMTAAPKFSAEDVNPDARNHLRAATAEERIISVLAAFPEYYKRYKSELAAELFITEFNRRVFVSLCEIINDCKEINSTAFGGDYTPKELGRIVKMIDIDRNIHNSEDMLNDCIRILKAENEKSSRKNIKDMSDDDFLGELSKIKHRKQRKD